VSSAAWSLHVAGDGASRGYSSEACFVCLLQHGVCVLLVMVPVVFVAGKSARVSSAALSLQVAGEHASGVCSSGICLVVSVTLTLSCV